MEPLLAVFAPHPPERIPTLKPIHMLPVGLASASIVFASPALAQMKTASPSSFPTPVPTSQPADTSLQASPSLAVSSPSLAVAEASPSLIQLATKSLEPKVATTAGFSLPSLPKMPVPLNVRLDIMSQGEVNTGGFVQAQTAVPSQTAPALAQASPSISASGMNLGLETSLLFLDLGARIQSFSFAASSSASIKNPPTGVTQTTVPDFATFFPSNLWELYGRLFGIKLGYRSETYPDGSNYGDLVGGLNVGASFFDMVGATAELQGGYAISKPPSLPSNIQHYTGDLDAYLFAHYGILRGRLGYKLSGVVDADPSNLMTMLTNPSSLLTNQSALTTLNATRMGSYSGPYAGIELDF